MWISNPTLPPCFTPRSPPRPPSRSDHPAAPMESPRRPVRPTLPPRWSPIAAWKGQSRCPEGTVPAVPAGRLDPSPTQSQTHAKTSLTVQPSNQPPQAPQCNWSNLFCIVNHYVIATNPTPWKTASKIARHPQFDKVFVKCKYIVDKELVGPTLYVLFTFSLSTHCLHWGTIAGYAFVVEYVYICPCWSLRCKYVYGFCSWKCKISIILQL